MVFRWLKITGLVLILLVGPAVAHAELQGDRAKEVKAAFLIKFSKFVKWPEFAFSSASAPMIVGILGRDPFGSVLDRIARSSRVNGRNVEVRRFDDLTTVNRSHILYITSEHIGDIEKILESFDGRPVLLVGESKNFLDFGSINFVLVNNRVRFNISKTNSDKYRLKISSKLLKVAHEIK
jgi:hypothetical protein